MRHENSNKTNSAEDQHTLINRTADMPIVKKVKKSAQIVPSLEPALHGSKTAIPYKTIEKRNVQFVNNKLLYHQKSQLSSSS